MARKTYSNIKITRNTGTHKIWVISYDHVGNENAKDAPKVDIDSTVIAPTLPVSAGDWIFSSQNTLPDTYPDDAEDSFETRYDEVF